MFNRVKIIKAFTLAEILITLGIIGIVAAITIPILINNAENAKLKTAFIKKYAELSSAIALINHDNGGTLLGVLNTSLYGLDVLGTKMSIVKYCDNGAPAGVCWSDSVKTLHGDITTDAEGSPAAILNNGAFIVSTMVPNAACSYAVGSLGSIGCGGMTIDVNGLVGPNQYGRDIFVILITQKGIYPDGAYTHINQCQTTDSTTRSGWGCSALALRGQSY